MPRLKQRDSEGGEDGDGSGGEETAEGETLLSYGPWKPSSEITLKTGCLGNVFSSTELRHRWPCQERTEQKPTG